MVSARWKIEVAARYNHRLLTIRNEFSGNYGYRVLKRCSRLREREHVYVHTVPFDRNVAKSVLLYIEFGFIHENRNTFQHFHPTSNLFRETKFICVHWIYVPAYGVKMFTCVHIKVTINHYIGADGSDRCPSFSIFRFLVAQAPCRESGTIFGLPIESPLINKTSSASATGSNNKNCVVFFSLRHNSICRFLWFSSSFFPFQWIREKCRTILLAPLKWKICIIRLRIRIDGKSTTKQHTHTINHREGSDRFSSKEDEKVEKKTGKINYYVGQMAMHYVYVYWCVCVLWFYGLLHRNNTENMFICDRLHLWTYSCVRNGSSTFNKIYLVCINYEEMNT